MYILLCQDFIEGGGILGSPPPNVQFSTPKYLK